MKKKEQMQTITFRLPKSDKKIISDICGRNAKTKSKFFREITKCLINNKEKCNA